MQNLQGYRNNHIKRYPSRKGVFVGNDLQKTVTPARQQTQQDDKHPQETPNAPALSLRLSVYDIAALVMLYYGLSRLQLLALCIACLLVAANKGPSVLKPLLHLLKEWFLPKDPRK